MIKVICISYFDVVLKNVMMIDTWISLTEIPTASKINSLIEEVAMRFSATQRRRRRRVVDGCWNCYFIFLEM